MVRILVSILVLLVISSLPVLSQTKSDGWRYEGPRVGVTIMAVTKGAVIRFFCTVLIKKQFRAEIRYKKYLVRGISLEPFKIQSRVKNQHFDAPSVKNILLTSKNQSARKILESGNVRHNRSVFLMCLSLSKIFWSLKYRTLCMGVEK